MINSLDNIKYYSLLKDREIDYYTLVEIIKGFEAEIDVLLISIHEDRLYPKEVHRVVIFESEEEMVRFNIIYTDWLYDKQIN